MHVEGDFMIGFIITWRLMGAILHSFLNTFVFHILHHFEWRLIKFVVNELVHIKD